MRIQLYRLPLTATSRRHVSTWWQIANPALRIMVIVIGTLGIVLGIFGALNTIETINATAASILVATIFGVVTIFQQRQSQRRQYTVDLLTTFVSGDRVSSATAWLADRGINNKPITGKVSSDERSRVSAALDYYELVAALALRGRVDVPIVLDLIGSSMVRHFELCRSYIYHRRATDAPYLYSDLELFLTEYRRYENRWQL
jgi:hypothetical protein